MGPGAREAVLIDQGAGSGARIDVLVGARALVRAPAPIVTSWGSVRVEAGGAVAAAGGSRTELCGGLAAVSDGGVLVAQAGRAVVDAGARVIMAGETGGVEVWALPGARVQADGGLGLDLVTQRPWGRVLRGGGDDRAAGRGLAEDLARLLEASRAMGPRR